jgi:hypothetical protein
MNRLLRVAIDGLAVVTHGRERSWLIPQKARITRINKWAFWQIVIRQQPQRRRYEQTVNEIRQTTVGADISNRHAGFARFTTIYRDLPDFTRLLSFAGH